MNEFIWENKRSKKQYKVRQAETAESAILTAIDDNTEKTILIKTLKHGYRPIDANGAAVSFDAATASTAAPEPAALTEPNPNPEEGATRYWWNQKTNELIVQVPHDPQDPPYPTSQMTEIANEKEFDALHKKLEEAAKAKPTMQASVSKPEPEPTPEPEPEPEAPVKVGGSMRENRAGRKSKVVPFKPSSPYLRQSMMKTYEMDPGTFYAQYENGHNESTIFTSTGTSVHGVMEDFFTAAKEGRIEPNAAEPDKTIIHWHEQALALPEFVKQCLSSWWAKYGWADEEWFSEFLGHIHEYLSRVIERGVPQVLAVEFEFKIEADAFGTPVSGTIDRVDRIDEDTIKIVDYKTNFMPFSAVDMANSNQFKMYTLAVSQLHDQLGPFKNVVCSYEMLRLGYAQSIQFNSQELEDFRVYMAMLWQKMLFGADRDFRPTRYSAFAAIRDENPEYNNMLHGRIQQLYNPQGEHGTAADVIKDLELITATLKTCKVRKDELDAALKSFITQAEGALEVDGYIYSMNAARTYSYDSQKVMAKLAMLGQSNLIPELASFTNGRLAKLLPSPIYSQIQAGADISYKAASITKKKMKVAEKATTKTKGSN